MVDPKYISVNTERFTETCILEKLMVCITNAISSREGVVGERRTVNGIQYEKRRNGRWKILYDSKLIGRIRRELVTKGKTQQEVADYFGLTRPAVSLIAKHNGFASDPNKKERGDRNREIARTNSREIKRLHTKEHVGAAELTRIFGFSQVGYVEQYLKSKPWKVSQSEIAKASVLREEVRKQQNHYLRNCYLTASLKSVRSYHEYKHRVRRLTALVLKDFVEILDPKNLRSPEWHIDHQISIFSGYFIYSPTRRKFVRRKELIPLHLVCHPANLKLLPRAVNSSKANDNHLTEKELLTKIKSFEKVHGKVFPGFNKGKSW